MLLEAISCARNRTSKNKQPSFGTFVRFKQWFNFACYEFLKRTMFTLLFEVIHFSIQRL